MKRRMFAWFLVMVLALGLISTTALAARKNVCTQIRGNAAAKQTFRVVTGSRWLFKDQITLTQEKGSYLFQGWTGRYKTVAMYGKYDVTYKKEGGRARTVKWTGRNCTLRLDRNSVYTVTIRPFDDAELQVRSLFHGYSVRWTRTPSWWIKSTKGIQLCR